MYPSTEKLKEMTEVAELFVTSQYVDGMKPKREKVIRELYGNTYDIQLEIRRHIKLIEESHLLGHDMTVIPYLVEEYSRLKCFCKLLTEELKRMKAVQEHKRDVETLLKILDAKLVTQMLVDDLKYFEGKFCIEVDIPTQMNTHKLYDFPDTEKERLEQSLDKYYVGSKNLRG